MISSRRDELVRVSKDFVERFEWPIIDGPWLWLRFHESARKLPPVRISERYEEDNAVFTCVKTALRDAHKKENADKMLVFDAPKKPKFVSRDELVSIDVNRAIRTFKRVEAFLHLYIVEDELSGSLVPFTELADDLDELIERFKDGEDDTTLLEPMRSLLRRSRRKSVRAVGSGVLALLSLALLTPAEQLPYFILSAGIGGLLVLIALSLYSAFSIWWSFPPLLSHPE